MESFWENFLIEIGFFCLMGALYYFYQRRKIILNEKNKIPITITYLLECALIDQTEKENPALNELILALDDFLKNPTSNPPFKELQDYAKSLNCSKELKEVIEGSLKEMCE